MKQLLMICVERLGSLMKAISTLALHTYILQKIHRYTEKCTHTVQYKVTKYNIYDINYIDTRGEQKSWAC